MKIKDYVELMNAVNNGEELLELENSISMPNGLSLKYGQKLVGANDYVFLSFLNTDGISLQGNNEISNISIQTSANKRAIYLDSTHENVGEIKLENLTITGVVQFLTRQNNKKLNLKVKNLDVVSADARNYSERPMKYGVIVYQGAFTVYNFNPDEESEIIVNVDGLSLGRENAPVIGSGVFISGFGDNGGKVTVEKLVTNDIFSNGMIPNGQPNLITGGIFIVYGANAKEIVSNGVVNTYGTNDMVLDVWGYVENWITKDDITSFGPSGIGFVNFGAVDNFVAQKTISTFGLGARGFNQYDGTIKNAYFEEIKTLGNGSIGMQFSKPVEKIVIGNKITTNGSKGQTLVKGVIKELQADGISVLEGGSIETLEIKGDIETLGDEVVSYHINGGEVSNFKIEGSLIARGNKSKEVLIENNGKSDMSDLEKYA